MEGEVFQVRETRREGCQYSGPNLALVRLSKVWHVGRKLIWRPSEMKALIRGGTRKCTDHCAGMRQREGMGECNLKIYVQLQCTDCIRELNPSYRRQITTITLSTHHKEIPQSAHSHALRKHTVVVIEALLTDRNSILCMKQPQQTSIMAYLA